MASNRKLQGEIDRCLKKVSEGVETFEDIWQKVHNAANSNQKEKYEADLKKEIKKLQRLRDQIKSWLASAEIKDKSALLENRKLIETQMERFKVVERETKTKAYSKEGLGAAQKQDPAQKERDEVSNWLAQSIDSLSLQVDQFESEIESLMVGCKKKKMDKDKMDRIERLKVILERHKFHIKKLEMLMRMLDNMSVECDQIKNLKEDVEYYIDYASQDQDFQENWFIYEGIDFDDLNHTAQFEVNMSGVDAEALSGSTSTTNSNSGSSPAPSPAIHNHSSDTADGSEQGPAKKARHKSSDDSSSQSSKSGSIGYLPSTSSRVQSSSSNSSSSSTSQGGSKTSSTPNKHVPGSTSQTTPNNSSSSSGRVGGEMNHVSQGQTTPSPSPLKLYAAAAEEKPTMSITECMVSGLSTTSTVSQPPLQPQPTQNHLPQPSSSPSLTETMPSLKSLAQNSIGLDSSIPKVSQAQSERTSVLFENTVMTSTSSGSPQTLEAHVPPLLGVAPLGAYPISKEQSIQYTMLEASFYHMPHPSDSERFRLYLPRNPWPTPLYYPQTPLPMSDSVELFNHLSTETLFFIFYYLEGTRAQYLAAKALKKQSWRFHTRFMMWFQRHEEPKTITDEYEMGTYIYFDYDKWSQRKKEGFTFEYKFLEDRDLV